MSKRKKTAGKQQDSPAAAVSQKNYFNDPPKNIEMEMPWIVSKVTPQDDYTLLLRFEDGKQGVFNMWPIIQQEDGGDDTFVHLENLAYFLLIERYFVRFIDYAGIYTSPRHHSHYRRPQENGRKKT